MDKDFQNDRGQVLIPPLSVVQLVRADKRPPSWKRDIGRIFQVGYCSKRDGLDCVWLVNDGGKYEQTTDHEFLYKYFDVIQFAGHKNWYGRRRPQITPIRRADGSVKNRR